MTALTKPRLIHQSPLTGTEVREDGSMVVTNEQLARFGNGDAHVGRRELRLLLAQDKDGPIFNGPTEKPASVRMAGPADEAACVALWIKDLEANAAHIAPIDEAKVLANVEVGTRQRGGFVGVIDGPDGSPVALLVLHPMQWHWGHGWFFQEMVNYVDVSHRNSRHVHDLIDFAKWWAEGQSKLFGYRVHVLCGVLGAWRVRAKIALYRRRMAQCGAVFIHPAPPTRGS